MIPKEPSCLIQLPVTAKSFEIFACGVYTAYICYMNTSVPAQKLYSYV